MLITPKWNKPDNIKAIITTKAITGYSTGIYQGCNLSYNVGEDPRHVAQNINKIEQIINLKNKLLWVKQVHGDKIINCSEIKNTDQPQEADAIFLDQANQACAILTADCLPVLLCNKQGTQAACIHAGWRGLAKEVIEKSITKFSSPKEIIAYLGPAISKNRYQVNEQMHRIFIEKQKENHKCFSVDQNKSIFGDLKEIAKNILLNSQIPINQIFMDEYCTYEEQNLFYSYRRDKSITGRQASIIWIEK